MILPLKQMRERADLSQEELALRIGISQGQVSRYENAPETIPFDTAFAWCQACGLSIEDAVRRSATEKSGGIDPGQPYEELHRHLDLLNQYVSSGPTIPPELPPLSLTAEDLRLKINQWRGKPAVMIAGRFDSGKTRIANALLGSDNLPTQYQPTTSVVTFVRHDTDRPKWQKEDVWIMGKEFDASLWNDENHCATNRLISGGFETLRRFGTRDSEGEEIGAKSALVYMDAPILQACTLIDVPGFQDNPEDDETHATLMPMADVLLYTSPAKGFLDTADLLQLGQLLRTFQPIHAKFGERKVRYANFFLIATQADPSISDEQIREIQNKGAGRLFKHLGDTIFKSGTHRLELPELRDRFFSFWYENQQRRDALEKTLKETLVSVMPAAITRNIDAEIKDIKAKTRDDLRKRIDAYENAVLETEAARRNIESLQKQTPIRLKKIEAKRTEVRQELERMKLATHAYIHENLAASLQVDAVEAFILEHYENDKDNAQKDAIAKLLEDIQSRLEDFLKKESEAMAKLIENYLSEYDVALANLNTPELNGFASIPFDEKAAFIGGLTGAGALGALGIWASGMGNLGGYILVAKFASVLSMAGIGIGSAHLVTLVSLIGGPVTVAVGIAALVAWGTGKIGGEAWERRLAKKITKSLQEKHLLQKIEETSNAYWEDTWKAFECGANAVEENFKAYLETNKNLLEGENSREKIEEAIAVVEDLRSFFGGIPWRWTD